MAGSSLVICVAAAKQRLKRVENRVLGCEAPLAELDMNDSSTDSGRALAFQCFS